MLSFNDYITMTKVIIQGLFKMSIPFIIGILIVISMFLFDVILTKLVEIKKSKSLQ